MLNEDAMATEKLAEGIRLFVADTEKLEALIAHPRWSSADLSSLRMISTGSTLQGMRMLLTRAGAEIVAEAAILTEGERAKWAEIISLGHLPVFTD